MPLAGSRQPLWELSGMAANPMKAAHAPQLAAATQGGRPVRAVPAYSKPDYRRSRP
ncbi:protein of unknown function [Pseudomonas inefficax]|uniref:Uncharacterized protein n=1 Tax=Pseudomonas inefficax TaxID=2078786 RepID=A0AAQ1PCV5_9PSED|nr:protein of unknown function [Pseudomonas inefficax]